jgi:hypothetical protein
MNYINRFVKVKLFIWDASTRTHKKKPEEDKFHRESDLSRRNELKSSCEKLRVILIDRHVSDAFG